jgi:hypothetical protein
MDPIDIQTQTSKAYRHMFGKKWGPKIARSKQQYEELNRLLSKEADFVDEELSRKMKDYFQGVYDIVKSGPVHTENVVMTDFISLLEGHSISLGSFEDFTLEVAARAHSKFAEKYRPFIDDPDEVNEEDLWDETDELRIIYSKMGEFAGRKDEIGTKAREVLEGLAAMNDIWAVTVLADIIESEESHKDSSVLPVGERRAREHIEWGKKGWLRFQRMVEDADWLSQNVDSVIDGMVDGSEEWIDALSEWLSHRDEAEQLDALNGMMLRFDKHPRMTDAVNSLIERASTDRWARGLLEYIGYVGAQSALHLWESLQEGARRGHAILTSAEPLRARIHLAMVHMPSGDFTPEEAKTIFARILDGMRGDNVAKQIEAARKVVERESGPGADIIPFKRDPDES